MIHPHDSSDREENLFLFELLDQKTAKKKKKKKEDREFHTAHCIQWKAAVYKKKKIKPNLSSHGLKIFEKQPAIECEYLITILAKNLIELSLYLSIICAFFQRN